MSWFNYSAGAVLPYLPKWLIKPFAKPYVAGETLDSVLDQVGKINKQGFKTTIDILGEHVINVNEALEVKKAYCNLYDRLDLIGEDNTVSLKLSHLGLELDPLLAEKNLNSIIEKSKSTGLGLTIDMEKSDFTDITLKIYFKAQKQHSGVGTVLQSYLHRSLDDLKALDSENLHLRICKGIYRESPLIAFQGAAEIRQNFFDMAKTLMTGRGYACLATHDITLIDRLEAFIENNNIPSNKFEFQTLLGVPMGNRLHELKEKGYAVRIYIPYGQSWFEYSLRRLEENPAIISYVLGNLFRR
ncbi:MAG: proline dehydrogenase family protein [Candidatus Neomarinimicrobiota bacterium]